MFYQYAKIDPDLIDILHKSTTYVDKDGKHPRINTYYSSSQIKINGEELENGDLKIAIEDELLLRKMIGQISSMQFCKNPVSIYFL